MRPYLRQQVAQRRRLLLAARRDRASALSSSGSGLMRRACRRLGIGRAEEGELGQVVVVWFEAVGGDLSLGEPGEAVAEDVVGEDPAVRIGGRLGAVVAKDVGEHL